MKVLLDTNICIYLIKRCPPQVLRRFEAYKVGDIGISSITLAELQCGAAKSQRVEQNCAALAQFLAPLEIAAFDAEAACVYGEIRAALERSGMPISALDTLIAAHALRLDVTLATNNVNEFARVPGLRVENWAAEE